MWFTFDADLFLRRRYSIILPNEILLSSIQTRLFMTDMPSRRAMSDSYLNTVLNVKKKEYQLSFAVQLDKGGITKQIAVFNPHFLPLDSLSLISLPSDYSIIDSSEGSLTQLYHSMPFYFFFFSLALWVR